MGGSVSVNVPLSATQLSSLNSEYVTGYSKSRLQLHLIFPDQAKRNGEGKTDDEIKVELENSCYVELYNSLLLFFK